MKKFFLKRLSARLSIFLLWFLLLSCASLPSSAEHFQNANVPKDLGEPVLLNLNGYYLLHEEPVSPFRRDGRVFVPLYDFLELFGIEAKYNYNVDWEKPPLGVTLLKDNIEVTLNNQSIVTITNTQTNETTIPDYSGKKGIWLEVNDTIYGVYVPLDIFTDAFGIVFTYNAETATIYTDRLDPVSSFLSIIKTTPLLYEVNPTPIIRPTNVKVDVIKEAT